MTHPLDKVYRFSTHQHWGLGHAENFLFGAGSNGGLVAPGKLEASVIAKGDKGPKNDPTTIRALAADPCGSLLWLQSDGTVFTLHNEQAFQIASLPASDAVKSSRLIWGQQVGWIVSNGAILRIDTQTGDRTGNFTAQDWHVADVVQDICDGAIVVETRGETLRLRQIRPEGRSRVLTQVEGDFELLAALRWQTSEYVNLVGISENGVRIIALTLDGHILSDLQYPGYFPAGPATLEGPDRVVLAHRGGGVFTIASGLAEPLRRITSADPMSAFAALLFANGTLYASAGRRILALREVHGAAEAESSTYYSPVLRSPLGDRSGWLRADVETRLPQGARVRISSKVLADQTAVAVYTAALESDPSSDHVITGWSEETASTHFGDGKASVLRHYLGHETAEHIALRIELSTPACAAAAGITGMQVYYPNRSLIDNLPAIYRNGTSSEAQFRRMLAPFQALADEIDDRIDDGIRRVDPAHSDDLWTGFLLGWLGHADFSRLPGGLRQTFLRALPEILRLRGTLAGLARVMQCLVPEGFIIEDGGLSPDVWVLPDARDPAGARLGRETAAAYHRPLALALGNCGTPLGDAVLKEACLSLTAQKSCSAIVTVRVSGGDTVQERLDPFTAHIARHFAPANTRLNFVFGDHQPLRLLERAHPVTAGTDPEALFTLDDESSRALSAWRLPTVGTPAHSGPPVLDEAHLDGTLVLA